MQHQIVNDVERAGPAAPVYSAARTRRQPIRRAARACYFTFTGPAIYTEGSHYKKIDFKVDREARPGDKPDHETSGDDGWVAMVQHYFISAWLIDDSRTRRPQPREFFTGKVDAQHLFGRRCSCRWARSRPARPGRSMPRLFVGPQEEDKLAQLAPGLELVKDYGWFTILAKPLFWLLTQLHKLLGNWGWSIVGLVVLLKIAFYWLNAKAYGSMAKMKAINPQGHGDARAAEGQAAADAAGDDAHLPRGEGQSARRLPADPGADAVLHRAVLGAAVERSRCATRRGSAGSPTSSAKDPYFILPLLMTGTTPAPDLAQPDAARSGAGAR